MMQPHWCKPHAPASMPCGFATAHQIGNRLRRVGNFLKTSKHLGRLRQYHNSVSLCLCVRLSAARLRQTPFPKIFHSARRLSQSAGERPQAVRQDWRHMNNDSMWRQTRRRKRIAHPRQLPKSGAVAPPAGSFRIRAKCESTTLAISVWRFLPPLADSQCVTKTAWLTKIGRTT